MALEQMDGFELAGRTVISANMLLTYPLRLFFVSFASTLSMRRELPSIPLRIRWMKRAVNILSPSSQNWDDDFSSY